MGDCISKNLNHCQKCEDTNKEAYQLLIHNEKLKLDNKYLEVTNNFLQERILHFEKEQDRLYELYN